jgi:hypothetical protein
MTEDLQFCDKVIPYRSKEAPPEPVIGPAGGRTLGSLGRDDGI